MEDINLDFLKTPPKHGQPTARNATPYAYNELNLRFGKKKSPANRKFAMAQTIAKVDELLQEIDRLRSQNNGLQERLKDFQQTAQQVQQLYSKEKQEHTKAKQNLEKLQMEYDKIDVDLTNKTLMSEQMKARLAEYEGRPINFNNLVVKYVRIMKKLEGEDILRYSPDKDLVEKLKEYCATMKLKIAPVSSPKKGKTRGNHKTKTHEMFVQCDILKEQQEPQNCPNCRHKPKMQDQNIQCTPTPPSMHDKNTQFSSSPKQDCLNCTNKPKTKDQNTQCSTTTATKRDQASQYISTMITRQTNTEKIIQKHVQTMFPEPQKTPAIDDILNVYSRWSNIRSVSPLLESPPSSRLKKDNNKKSINIGTCTMLCNIRRKIDYLQTNQANNIKQEIITPSASPTPNANPITTTTNRVRMNSLSSSNNISHNQYASSILNLFNPNTNSALGQLSSNAFNELWQIFGKMLLSLLQTSNAGIANTNQNSALNQQQFLDWLLELYMSSQPPNTSSTQTQTLQQMDNSNDSRQSPICFNESSTLSRNVVRPEAQKIAVDSTNIAEESVETLRGDSVSDKNTNAHQQQTSITPITNNLTITSSVLLENYSQDSNSMDREIQQIHNASNTTEIHNTNPFKETNTTDEENLLKKHTKSSNKPKNKHKLLDQIQELIPELNLNKKKRKALKRLLKTKNHRKKSFETRKSKPSKDTNKPTSVVMISNENVCDETEETAVDFLKTFAFTQGEHISETEKNFLEQSSITLTETSNAERAQEEFNFIKPTSSLPRTKYSTGNGKDLSKRKKTKTCKNIANKYQLLFGDSDSEHEELEMEVKNSQTVIKTKLNLSEESQNQCNFANDITNVNDCSQNWSNEGLINSTNLPQTINIEDSYISNTNIDNQTCHLTLRNATIQQQQQGFSLPILTTPIFEMSCDSNISYEHLSIPDLPTPLLKNLESEHLPHMELPNYSQPVESDVCLDDIEKDLEISSDDNSCSGEEGTETIENKHNLNNKPFKVPSIRGTQVFATHTDENCSNIVSKSKLNESNTSANIENTIKCLPNLNDEDAVEDCSNVEMQPKEFHAYDLKNDLELSSDNENSQRKNNTDPMNDSDFEQDLEISSDNESQLSERFYNDINQLAAQTTEEMVPNESFKTLASNTALNQSINQTTEEMVPNESFKTLASTTALNQSQDKRISEENLCANEENNVNSIESLEENFEDAAIFCQEELNQTATKSSQSNLECKDKSLCWSVIIISDSTVTEETLDKSEIKSNNETGAKAKISELNTIEDNQGYLKVASSTNPTASNTSKEKFNNSKDAKGDTKDLEGYAVLRSTNITEENARLLKSPTNYNSDTELFNETDNILSNCNLKDQMLEKDETTTNKDHMSNISLDTEDETDFNDSLSLENELMIDEEPNEPEIIELNSSTTLPQQQPNESYNETLNTSNISTLLDSSLYNDVLTESLNPIVEDLLKNNDVEVEDILPTENKTKRGRKRKSECLTEVVVLPCKRSQRLKAKQMLLDESLNLSKTPPIKLGKYTKINKITNNVQLKEDIETKIGKTNCETTESNRELRENEVNLEMGFFRESLPEVSKAIEAKSETSKDKSDISEDSANNPLNITKLSFDSNELGNKEQTSAEELRTADTTKSLELNFTYTDSPQSPPPLENHNETFINIPAERLSPFKPHQNNQTLFDVLISSYRNDNQKQIVETLSNKESECQKSILTQYHKQLTAYCYSHMELDPNCTSQQLINKLLSISPDYGLIQKALIYIAQNAESSNVKEMDLPSITQEMPPRHLSKCLQRLFSVLRNLLTRNSSFCQELIDKIELLLFNRKQTENLSLQATLNITQLYLMACKVQEYAQMPKHPARLFIAKCLYFYLQKSTLMIHEVLMWYPTVLPYREDKTYDRSDALISVIQQILMSTKYDMDKEDLRGKSLLSKLRYEYHFEPFKPALDVVINVLVEKLKNSKFYNISLSYGLLCKRLGVPRTQQLILAQHLLPLANEYYTLALKTCEYDKRIAVLLEIISMIVKPFPIDSDVKIYFNEFARFLNNFERRQLIQEAALCSILRLQRFDVEYCYNLLRHYQPTYDLNIHTQAMLKTFLHRRPLTFWMNLKSKNPTNLI